MGQLQIIFFGTFSFPSGDAAGARVMELARGAVDEGMIVKVVSLFGEASPYKWSKLSHNHGQICFLNTGVSKNLGSSHKERMRSRLHFYRSRTALYDVLQSVVSSHDKTIIYFYGRSYFYLKRLFKIVNNCKSRNVICLDITEPPVAKKGFRYLLKHPFAMDSMRAFSKNVLNRIDVGIFISFGLMEDYGKYFTKSLVIPSVLANTSDNDKIEQDVPTLKPKNVLKLGYVGALLPKDDPSRLIWLCQIIEQFEIEVELNVLGKSNYYSEGIYWRSRLNDSSLKNKIVYHDNVSRSRLDEVLKEMDFNILLRKRDDLQLKTFPTRIIDLMKVKRPLILNLFGDLNQYFTNEINCIDIDSIVDWSDIINKIQDEKFRNTLAVNSYELLNESFKAQRHIAKLGKLCFDNNGFAE